jgi:phospholipid/cholesterol/gamma-HCH transport system permease protein
MSGFLQNIGAWFLNTLHAIIILLAMISKAGKDFISALHYGRRPIIMVYLKQVYFTGLEALKIIMIISLTIGTIIITQIINLAGTGNEALTGKVLIWVVIRELGPLLTAIIVVARSGTAIATELGAMKINGEIESIEALGISAEKYLIMPRIFGVATAVVILTLYFEIIAILGGFLVASLGWNIHFEQFSRGVLASLTIKEIAFSVIKSVCFGLFLTAACCKQGLGVGKSATQIPQAGTKGVMQSLFLVFTLDGVITLISSIAK